jgi:hypothetical protein
VKSQVPAGGVDANKAKPPEQEGQQFDVGLKSTSTGEDPAHEDDYKGTKDDPGTAHPAKTEDGEKYSSMNFIQLKKLTEKKANAILASVAVTLNKRAELKGEQHKLDVDGDKKLESSDFAKLRKGQTAHKTPAAPKMDEKKAAAVGYDQAVQAGVLSQEDASSFFKSASENLIRGALSAATATGQYLTAFNQQLLTKAAEEGEGHEGGEMAGHEESESPAQESAENSGDIGVDEGDLAAMAGEAPPAGGAMGGEEGGVDELLAALAEMGVSPEEVMAAMSAQGAGAGGAPAPEAMGAIPAEALAAEAPKMASAGANQQIVGLMKAAKARARSGKFQISAAKTAGQRKLRDEIKKCIAEIVG